MHGRSADFDALPNKYKINPITGAESMIRKSTMAAATFASLVLVGWSAPQISWAGEAERSQYQQCLADSANKPNETQARSECTWKHWAYMASYGP
jgi:hypothetical protein